MLKVVSSRTDFKRRCTLWDSEDKTLLGRETIKVTDPTPRLMPMPKARGRTLVLDSS
jgi:hypothetical protein